MYIVFAVMDFRDVKGRLKLVPFLDDDGDMNIFPSIAWLKDWKKDHQLKNFEWLVIDMNTLDMEIV